MGKAFRLCMVYEMSLDLVFDALMYYELSGKDKVIWSTVDIWVGSRHFIPDGYAWWSIMLSCRETDLYDYCG